MGRQRFRMVAIQLDVRRRYLVPTRHFEDDHVGHERFLDRKQRQGNDTHRGTDWLIGLYSHGGLNVRRLRSDKIFRIASTDG